MRRAKVLGSSGPGFLRVPRSHYHPAHVAKSQFPLEHSSSFAHKKVISSHCPWTCRMKGNICSRHTALCCLSYAACPADLRCEDLFSLLPLTK